VDDIAHGRRLDDQEAHGAGLCLRLLYRKHQKGRTEV
jgi:hypothetical protein